MEIDSASIRQIGQYMMESKKRYTGFPGVIWSYYLKTYEWLIINDKRPNIRICDINAELINHFARHPNRMLELPPYKFEVLIAELLKDMGYQVSLTPQSRDGNRDIFAFLKMPSGSEILTIVECKKFAHNRKVGIDIVERFLWTIRDKDKANSGLIATTSYLSRDARFLQEKYRWLLSTADFDKLKDWLQNYGSLTKGATGGNFRSPKGRLNTTTKENCPPHWIEEPLYRM